MDSLRSGQAMSADEGVGMTEKQKKSGGLKRTSLYPAIHPLVDFYAMEVIC